MLVAQTVDPCGCGTARARNERGCRCQRWTRGSVDRAWWIRSAQHLFDSMIIHAHEIVSSLAHDSPPTGVWLNLRHRLSSSLTSTPISTFSIAHFHQQIHRSASTVSDPSSLVVVCVMCVMCVMCSVVVLLLLLPWHLSFDPIACVCCFCSCGVSSHCSLAAES